MSDQVPAPGHCPGPADAPPGSVSARAKTQVAAPLLTAADLAGRSAADLCGLVLELQQHRLELECKLAGQRLEESEARFRALFDNGPDGALVIDAGERRILLANAAICRLLGYGPEELAGLDVAAIHPESERDRVRAEFARGALRKKHFLPSVPVQRRDGTVFAADISASHFTMGERRCVVGLFRDTAEREQTEAHSRISHDLMQALAAATRLDAGLRLCVDAAIRAAGLDAGGFYLLDEATGVLNLCVHQGLSDAFVGAVTRFGAGTPQANLAVAGTPVFGTFETLPLALTAAKLQEGLRAAAMIPVCHEGRPIGCLNVASHSRAEIPAAARMALETIAAGAAQAIVRLQAQEALRASEEKHRGIFDESVVAIYVFDRDKHFVDANQTGLALLGYTRDELLRRSMADVDADPVVVLPAHQELLAGGRLINYEHRLRRKDGAIITVLNNSRPLSDACGCIVGMQSTLIDITDRRRLEAERESALIKYRTLFDAFPLGITVADREGHIVEANRVAEDLLGTSSAEQARRSVDGPQWQIVRPDGSPMPAEEYAGVRALREQRRVENVEIGVIKPSGEMTWVDVTAAPVSLPDIGVVITYGDVSARRRAEEALREREHLLAEMGRLAKVGGWELDAATGAGRWTEEVGRIHDLDPHIQPNREMGLSFYPGGSRERLATAIDQAITEGVPYDLELEFVSAEGVRKWVHTLGMPIMEGGQVVRLRGALQDITERKQAESVLRERLDLQDQLAKVAATVPGLICSFRRRPDGSFCMPFATSAIMELYGLQPEDVRDDFSPVFDRVFPEDRGRLEQTIAKSARTMEPWRDTFRIRHPQRGEVWVEGHSVPRLEPDGSIFWHGFVQDVTERQRAAEALATESIRRRILIDGSRDGIVVLDQEGRVFEANRRFADMLGYSGSEVAALQVSDWDSQHSRAEVEEMLRTVGAAGDHFETRHRRKDGSVFPVEISTNAAHLGGQKLIFCVCRDISERKRLESQLREAQKLEAVGRLAGGIAHDFNNLLMGIMNYADLCRDELPTDHAVRPWLDEITADAERTAGITRQLLAFARRQTIAPVVLDLNDHVAGMLKLLRRLIGEDIDLAWLQQAREALVKMDPAQVDQILANLAVNARDAIGGVGRLTVETADVVLDAAFCAKHPDAVPGAYVLLAVSDTGCGMDRATLEHLFEPFFTTKGVGKGTGLGLATVYGIVQQNHGFVDVSSEPGKGTTFRVYLPRQTQPAAMPAAVPAAATAPPPRGGTETILLVEDEDSIRVTSTRFLQGLGYAVLAAATPMAALRLEREHHGPIALLVTDVVMPEMSGRALATHLTQSRPGLRCLFMSGYTADVIAPHGVLDEGVEFLQKPISRTQLADKVRQILDR